MTIYLFAVVGPFEDDYENADNNKLLSYTFSVAPFEWFLLIAGFHIILSQTALSLSLSLSLSVEEIESVPHASDNMTFLSCHPALQGEKKSRLCVYACMHAMPKHFVHLPYNTHFHSFFTNPHATILTHNLLEVLLQQISNMRSMMSSAICQTNHVVGPCMELNKIKCTVWTGNGGPE
jgi:hypothetical protein